MISIEELERVLGGNHALPPPRGPRVLATAFFALTAAAAAKLASDSWHKTHPPKEP